MLLLITDVKALFRRGCAHLQKPEHANGLSEALKDLGRALELDPANREVAQWLAKARAQQKELDKNERARFGRMVSAADFS